MADPRTLPSLAGLLLMGGQSLRMGRDKSALVLDGELLWKRQFDVLASVSRPVFRSVPYGHPPDDGVLPDPMVSPGPLPGIANALEAMPTDWLLVLAVDVPGVNDDVVRRLFSDRVEGGVVMARVAGEAQPLLAVWHRAVLSVIRERLGAGERAVRTVLARVPTRVVDLAPPLAASLAHFNTPEDLAVYEAGRRRRWLQVVGYSGVGKTSVLTHLLRRLAASGESAATVKVSHHPVQDKAGGDTARLRASGADTTWLVGPDGLFREGPVGPEDLVMAASGAWLLVEGGRSWPTPKIVIGNAGWPAHAPPVVGSVGGAEALAPHHLAVRMPDGAEQAAEWIFGHRFQLSVPLDEVRHGRAPA